MEPFWEKMGLSTEPQMWRASELLDCLRQHRQDGGIFHKRKSSGSKAVTERKKRTNASTRARPLFVFV